MGQFSWAAECKIPSNRHHYFPGMCGGYAKFINRIIDQKSPVLQGAVIRTGQKTFFAKVDGPENFGRL